MTGLHLADAGAAGDLVQVARLAARCRACPAMSGRLRSVPGDFPAGARLLLVGEAPGADEDRVGRPFVGRAGELLDRLLVEVGFPRATVAVANVLKCRPPGNRTPTRREVAHCRPYLDRQLTLAAPGIVLTMGATAAYWAFGAGRLADLRGRVHLRAGRAFVATYHPAAALRFGPAGAPMSALRADLRLVADLLERGD